MNGKIGSILVLTLLLLSTLVSPVFAKGPPVIVQWEETVPYENPCTGVSTTITHRYTLRIHDFEQNDRIHGHGHWFVESSTLDGFEGKTVADDVFNRGSDTLGRYAVVLNSTLKNKDTGQIVKMHLNAQFWYVCTNPDCSDYDADYIVDQLNVWCAGK